MTDLSLKDPNNPSGPVQVHNYKIAVDRDLCIGAATCIAVAGKAFELDSEAKAVVLQTADAETIEALIDAARACPVAAITIEDENGNKIFPQ
ncbi:ferredoxin [Candidatus Roizmanbacteria bacterium]|nr:ferredoxin [Candidatus Roizmanbacteria bacterium]